MIGSVYVFTGSRVKKMRLDNNWTQKNLADKLGLKNDTAIANYESGYSIPKDEIKLKMCELFNCSIDYLMETSYYKNNQELQSSTNHVSAFWDFSGKDIRECIVAILQELVAMKGFINIDAIETLAYDRLVKYRIFS